MKRKSALLGALCALGMLAAPVASADSIKTCSGPHDQFTYTQKGSCNSSHPEVATNPGGNQPPGQQP